MSTNQIAPSVLFNISLTLLFVLPSPHPSLSSSVFSIWLILSRGTWRPSLWSRCSSIQPTTPESQAISVTQRLPPFGTTRPWPQTGTGSTPAKQPSRVASGPWHRTASAEIRRHLQLERHAMNSETEMWDSGKRDELTLCAHCCVYTHLNRHLNNDLTFHICIHTHIHRRMKAGMRCPYNLLPEEGTLRREQRGRRAESGTRASKPLTKALFIPCAPPLGMWTQLRPET